MRDGRQRFCEQIGVNPGAMTAPFLKDTDWAMRAAEAVVEMLDEDRPDASNDGEEITKRELDAT